MTAPDLLIAAFDDGGMNTAAELRAALEAMNRFSGARVGKSSATNISSSGSWQPVSWGTVEFDTDGYADLDNDRLIVPWAGWYEATLGLRWEWEPNDWVHVIIKDGGAAVGSGTRYVYEYAEQSERLVMTVRSGPILLAQDDSLAVEAQHETNGDVEVADQTWFAVHYLGPDYS